MAKNPVKVWSSVGVTLPIPETYANIRFSFGHERYAKSDGHNDLTDTEEQIHIFNTKILERRLDQHRQMVEALVKHKKKGKK